MSFKQAYVGVWSEEYAVFRGWSSKLKPAQANLLLEKVRPNLVLPTQVPGQVYGVQPSNNALCIALLGSIAAKTLQGFNASDEVGALIAVAKIRPFFLLRVPKTGGMEIKHVDVVSSTEDARTFLFNQHPEFIDMKWSGGALEVASLKLMVAGLADAVEKADIPTRRIVSNCYEGLTQQQARDAFDVLREYVDLGRIHEKVPHRRALDRICGQLYDMLPRPNQGLTVYRHYMFERDVYERLTALGRLDLEHRPYMSWSRTAADAISSLGPFHLYRIVVDRRDLIYVVVRHQAQPREIVVDIEALCARAGYHAKTHLWNGGEAEFILRHDAAQSIPFSDMITIDFKNVEPQGLREYSKAAHKYMQSKLAGFR